jgi:predicted transcriptional regulator
MPEAHDVLISLSSRHTDSILDGSKTVELRRRAVNVQKGGRVWIYTKVPRGSIEVYCTVNRVVAETPQKIWASLGSCVGLTKAEFDEYFFGLKIGYAIVLGERRLLPSPIGLVALKGRFKRFQPPQFVKYLVNDSPELDFLLSQGMAVKKKAA